MKFRLDRKSYITAHRTKGTRKRVITLATIVLLLYVGGFVITRFAGPLVRLVGYPFVELGNSINTHFPTIYQFFSTQKHLVSDNRSLHSELEQANIKLLKLKELEADNADLRARLGYRHTDIVPIEAHVISKPDQNAYDVITLDIGSSTAVRLKQGDLVTAYNTVALGVVDSVGATMTKVKLFSSAGIVTPVLIGHERIPGIATGQGGGNFSLTLPKDVSVVVGDSVMSTSTDSFLFGIVGSITITPDKAFQTVNFRNPVNFINLNWVEVYDR